MTSSVYLDKAPYLGNCYMMSIDKLTASIGSFFANPIILSSLCSWLFSQLVKGLIALLRSGKKNFRGAVETLLWRTGGMPSSHAAVVSSMTAAVGFHEGLGSNLFAVSMMVALVVIRDAMGVRRATGLQARAINILGKKTAEALKIEFSEVKEIQGHDPLEVIVGGLLGILVSAAFAWL